MAATVLLNVKMEPNSDTVPQSVVIKKSLRPMLILRRLHLYLGLFLFPWVLLYGISAFLFNHPEVAGRQPLQRFDSRAFVGTPMALPVDLATVAQQVVDQLNERYVEKTLRLRADTSIEYAMGGTGGSELIFGSMTFPDRKVHLLFHVLGSGGTARIEDRSAPTPSKTTAPFEVIQQNGEKTYSHSAGPIRVQGAIDQIALESIPRLIRNLGYDSSNGESRITQVPDLTFVINDGDRDWRVRYNSVHGTVSGTLSSEAHRKDISTREFMTRLHAIHVYPFSYGARFVWTCFVDIMAALMVYWGVSGLLMWWQIKRTRKLGVLTLVLSIAIGFFVAVELYEWLSRAA